MLFRSGLYGTVAVVMAFLLLIGSGFRIAVQATRAFPKLLAGPIERAGLHAAVGAALERLYAANLELVAPQLARHYLAADSAPDADR